MDKITNNGHCADLAKMGHLPLHIGSQITKIMRSPETET